MTNNKGNTENEKLLLAGIEMERRKKSQGPWYNFWFFYKSIGKNENVCHV